MDSFYTSVCLSVVLCLVVSGCAGSKAKQQAAVEAKRQSAGQPASPELRLADHHEWVKRLMASKPVSGIQQISATNGATSVVPIPLPASVTTGGLGYALLVDSQAKLVWLQTHGYNGQVMKVDGPWKQDQADAAHLLHSITSPPVMATTQR